MKDTILNHRQIKDKLRRIALQILETNSDDEEIVLAGISTKGFIMAQHLQNIISEYSTVKTLLCEIIIDKKNVLSPVKTSLHKDNYQHKYIVVIDDVLNSGTTLIYAVKHFLEVPLSKLKTAVLINRNHKKYPIKADFKGLSLSTSIHEHIEVTFDKENTKAVLV